VPPPPTVFDRVHTPLPPGLAPFTFTAVSSTTVCRWHDDVRPVAILLQHLQGKGVGFYLAVSSFHLPRLAKIVESLMRSQEHQYLVFAPELQGTVSARVGSSIQ
jgi:hypothetical protein